MGLLDWELKDLAVLLVAVVGGIWLAIFYVAFSLKDLMGALVGVEPVWFATVGTLWLAGLVLFFIGGMAYSVVVMAVVGVAYEYVKRKITESTVDSEASQ